MKAVVTKHGFADTRQERAALAPLGCELIDSGAETVDEIIAAARDAEALFVQFAPVPAAVIEGLQRCRVILRYGIGVDNVDLAAAAARGIAVCNVPDYCIEEVADHAAAMALALLRQVPQTDARLRAGTWSIVPPGPVPALAECTLATVGFGRIARALHRRLRAFGCRGVAYDPFAPAALFAEHGVSAVDLDTCFRDADLISLHCPLNADTQHLVDAARLRRMRRHAVLINTARGPLVDGVALASALREGLIGGAGIDVFEKEPLPEEHPLRAAPNALLTSHTAWNSTASLSALQRLAGEEVARVLRGEAPINRVN